MEINNESQSIISAEKPLNPGRKRAITSIVLAVLSLAFFPPVLGVAGIILGIWAYRKGEKTVGLIGIILSAVFMVIGMILGATLSIWLSEKSGAALFDIVGNMFSH